MKRIIAVMLVLSFAVPAFSHELTIKAKDSSMKAGEAFHVTVQSAHKFIVPEEVWRSQVFYRLLIENNLKYWLKSAGRVL